ncbi:hypothetical protein BCR35DRAFT_354043 [Leucosporidium creatinivorum]|uniref:Uncharacterized protein n=1 Tax=Leucosporidium creatinivorum TaxID=106004 RepID=A0A1Y2ERX8_9BASI|nr:hypothetical protein BCR35DRAFT_354043 [Leucosporidium creatinivorum]
MASLARFRPLLRSAAPLRPFSSSALRANVPPKPISTSTVEETVPPEPLAAEAAPLSTPPPPPPAPEPEPAEPAPVARVRRPVGAFRGGLIGFLLGTTLVGGYGYFQLLDDYSQASSLLLLSVEELKTSTEQMASHIQRIERVERELGELVKTASSKKDVESLRKEYRKLIESEHLASIELRARVWGIEQDLHALTKHTSTSIRI